MRFVVGVVLWCVLLTATHAQEKPKREMRATWLTTVWGLDWPAIKVSSTGNTYTINVQKQQLINLLDNLKEANMNTVFFQVRSECDAMYQSSYEPWSSHLVTTRGMDPGYDPLAFAVEEAHKRGLELHAWLNPYRFESVVGKYEGLAGDYRVSNPNWVLEYPDKSDGSKNVALIDPGNPEVRQRIVDVVKEIILNYDVDGITFDDYFYAYGGTPDNLDAYSQNLYKPTDMDLHDWRRANVNLMVADVYQMIQQNEPWVTFGLSPFGIWTTDNAVAAREGITLPQGIVGMNAYKDIYCDPVAWMKEGTVDYVSPQIYWPTTSIGQDYDVLSPWWSDLCNRFRTHLYVSHSLYSLESSTYAASLKSAKKEDLAVELDGMSMLEYFASRENANLKATELMPTEYGMQIQVNRDADKNGAPGSVFFRTANFYKLGFVNYLTSHEYSSMALAPSINWKTYADRTLPTNLRVETGNLLWNSAENNVRFVVYAVPNDKFLLPGNTAKADYIIGVSYDTSFDLGTYAALESTHKFGVSVLDRFGNEFPVVMMDWVALENEAVNLVYPTNGGSVYNPFVFKWDAVLGAENYVIEVAEDAAFLNVMHKREVTGNEFPASHFSMEVGNTYYWRVATRKLGVVDVYSPVYSFNLVEQPKSTILSPSNNATGVSLTPTIEWSSFGNGFVYQLQIAINNTFTSITLDQSDIALPTFEVPTNTLSPYKSYYLRVRATDGQAVSAWSDVVKVSTIEAIPSVPIILSPTEGENLGGTETTIMVESEPYASSFTVWLSISSSFPLTDRKVVTMQAFDYDALYSNLEIGTYYVKVRANYASGLYTAWSSTRSFSIVATGIDDGKANALGLSLSTKLSDKASLVNFNIPAAGKVKLSLYNLSGQEVRVLKNERMGVGEYSCELETERLTHGLYILILQTEYAKKAVKLIK